jgi:DNA-binding NtrC family response regulator
MAGSSCEGCRVRDARIAELEARIAELAPFQLVSSYLRDEAKAERDLRTLTGESQAMKAVRLAIQQVARTESTVLNLGETGTGARDVPSASAWKAWRPRAPPMWQWMSTLVVASQ